MNFFEAMKYLRYGIPSVQVERKGFIYQFQNGVLCWSPSDKFLLSVDDNGDVDEDSDIFQPCFITKSIIDAEDFEVHAPGKKACVAEKPPKPKRKYYSCIKCGGRAINAERICCLCNRDLLRGED